MQLIAEKITIPQERPGLPRPRVMDLMWESLLRHSATVISGRAGTGKTILASEFARQCGRPVAWFKADATDNRPDIFLRYLEESVRRQRPGFRLKWEEVDTADVEYDSARLAESFVIALQETGQEAGAEPLLLVIDDLHHVYDEAWVSPFFARLVPLLPPDVHLLIVARGVPPAPLWRMRSKQLLTVIDENYLTFTLDEARRLFAAYGLSADAVVKPLTVSHGRAAVLDAIAREKVEAAGARGIITAA